MTPQTKTLPKPQHPYPFGLMMPGRSWSDGYRFGFNGKENTNEVYGNGNAVDFGARMYDARLGRWLAVDTYEKKYPYLSPYLYAVNSPLKFIDVDGNDIELKGDVSPDELKALLNTIFSDMVEVTVVRKANRDFLELKLVTNQDHLSREQTALFSLLSGMQGSPSIYPMYLAHRGTDPTTTGNYDATHIQGNFELNLQAFTYLPESDGFSKTEMLWHEFHELKLKIGKEDQRAKKEEKLNLYSYFSNSSKMTEFYEEDHKETLDLQAKAFGITHDVGYISSGLNEGVEYKDLDIVRLQNGQKSYVKTMRFSTLENGETWSVKSYIRHGLSPGDTMNEDNSLKYDTEINEHFNNNK